MLSNEVAFFLRAGDLYARYFLSVFPPFPIDISKLHVKQEAKESPILLLISEYCQAILSLNLHRYLCILRGGIFFLSAIVDFS